MAEPDWDTISIIRTRASTRAADGHEHTIYRNGESLPNLMEVTVHFSEDLPTTVYVNGQRVTKPTRVMRNGTFIAADLVGQGP